MKLQQMTKRACTLALAAICAIGMLPTSFHADENKPTYEPLDYKCISTALGGMDLSTDGSTWVKADGSEALFVFADSSSAKLNLKKLGLGTKLSVAEYTAGKKCIYVQNDEGKNILVDENGKTFAGISGYQKCQYLVGDYDGSKYDGWFSYYDEANQKFHLCDTTGKIQLSIDYITQFPSNLHFIHFGGYFILINYNGEVQCVFEPTGKAEILLELPQNARISLAKGVISSNRTYYTPDWKETTAEVFQANPIISDTSTRVPSSDEVYKYKINGVTIYANTWTGEIWDEYDQKIITEDTGDVTILYSYEDILMVPIISSEGCTFKVVPPKTEEDTPPVEDNDSENNTPSTEDANSEDNTPSTEDKNSEDNTPSTEDTNSEDTNSEPDTPSTETTEKPEVSTDTFVEEEIKSNNDGSASVDVKLETSGENISLNAPANVVPENSSLRVEKIENGERFEAAQNALKDDVKENGKLVVFEIDLLDQATEVKVQPNGSLTITITLSKALSSSEAATVYRIELDGTKTKMTTRVVDGKVEFDTDHFSTYAVVVNTAEATPENTPGITPFLLVGLVIILAGAVAGFVYYKKRTTS